MACKQITLQVSTQQATEGELSVSIMDQIRATHVHADDNFDVEFLLAVVKNILNGAFRDDKALGAAEAQRKEKAQEASFSLLIKQLSIEVAWRDLGVEIPCKTTMSVLKRLSSYSWNAKAVLSLAAFASNYGEFWLLNQFHPSDQLAKSVRILKGVPTILKLENKWIPKQIVDLDKLIKATLEVIECIFKLEKLFKDGDIKDVPALSTVMGDIPVYVYWSITTIVACTTQLFGLNDEGKTQELSPFIRKINETLDFLKMHIELCNNHMNYLKLVKIMRNQTDIVVVFKELRFGTLIDGSANIKDGTEELKTKNFLLLFSSLDVSNDDISILRPIYEEISNYDQYKFVWIPIEDQWTDDMQKKFEMLQSKMPPWCIVHKFSFQLGIKYIKEEWQFKDKPIVVVMNSQGIVEHPNALPMITISGKKAFPFTSEKEQELSNEVNWFGNLIIPIIPKENEEVLNSIKLGEHIIFYGGKNEEWRNHFNDEANRVTKRVKNNANISINLFCMENGSKGQKDECDILSNFWNCIESFLHKKIESEVVRDEVQKLFSYQTEGGWAVLCKGSKLVDSGHERTILEALDKLLGKKYQHVPENDFEDGFKEFYNESLRDGDYWFGYLMTHIFHQNQEVLTSIKPWNYIFFYGGNGEEWKKEIDKKASTLAKEQAIHKDKIFIHHVENFWVEFLKKYTSKLTGEKQKLSTFKHEKEWAVLCKGYRFIDCCKNEELGMFRSWSLKHKKV